MRHGLFSLPDATDAQAERFVENIACIDYPWWRLLPRLNRDRDRAVVVKWDALRQGVTGLFYGNSVEIHLSELDRHIPQEAFVLAHEVGHLVDAATLTDGDRAELLALMHAGPPVQIGHFDHDHPDAGHTVERWRTSEPYPARINEAYADLFVATFAPTLWEGRFPRFVHWTDDLDTVRNLTLRRPIMAFTDVPEDATHAAAIHELAVAGVIEGFDDGTFRPDAPVTRGQLATILHRQAKAAK